jgi:fatty acid synthase
VKQLVVTRLRRMTDKSVCGLPPACSSSLLALHDAVADLAAGRVDYAMVGGSSAILSPAVTVAFNELHMLSPEATCKSFDAAGNGYTRADGIAVSLCSSIPLANHPALHP